MFVDFILNAIISKNYACKPSNNYINFNKNSLSWLKLNLNLQPPGYAISVITNIITDPNDWNNA